MHRIAWGTLAVLAACLLPAAASAGTLETTPLPGVGNGIAKAADGSYWIATAKPDAAASTLTRVTADGQVSESAPLGAAPVSVTFAGGKVWATLTATHQLAIVNPAAPGTVTTVPTATNRCGPSAIVDGGNGRVYVSLPQDGVGSTCSGATASAIQVFDATSGAALALRGSGAAFDLLVANGSLFVPSYDLDQVTRMTLDAANTLPTTAVYTPPAGAGAHSMALDADKRVVTTFSGAASIGRISPFSSSAPFEVESSPIPEANLYGVAAVGSSVYAAAQGSSGGAPALVRFKADDTTEIVPLGSGVQPWRMIAGPGGSVWATDQASQRLLRYTSIPPAVAGTGASAVTANSAAVGASVEPGGNETALRVEYGLTAAYGQTATLTPQNGVGPRAVAGTLGGLAAGTTYHWRIVATSSEGIVPSADATFVTSAAAVPTVVAATALKAKIKFTAKAGKRTTAVSKIRVTGLVGGETITVTCKGTGCPKKGKKETTKVKKAGSKTVGTGFKKSALRAKATLTVQVRKAGSIGVQSVLTVRKAKAPTTVERCLPVSGGKAVKCAA